MASFEGDVIYAPGYAREEVAAPVEIMYSMAGLVQKGGTLTPGQGDLPAGTAVVMDTATKRYRKATTVAETEGFLRIGVSTGDASALPKQGVIVFGGVLKSALVGTHLPVPTAPATLPGDLATALGGHYNASRGFLKF